jgi:hypothetical protein
VSEDCGKDADGLRQKSLAVGCSSTGFIIKYELIYASLRSEMDFFGSL